MTLRIIITNATGSMGVKKKWAQLKFFTEGNSFMRGK